MSSTKESGQFSAIQNDEEFANNRKVEEWLVPLLQRHNEGKPLSDIALLSVGCGFGADVDALVRMGVNAYGVEPLARTEMWHSRENIGRFLRAEGGYLPIRDGVFDVVYCAEVLEHVGYEAKQDITTASVLSERERLVQELVRVTKEGGLIVITTPNRHFCIDIGHWGANFLGLRFHSPFNDFTLSFAELWRLFVEKCGCRDIGALPYRGFITWSIYRERFPVIRLLEFLLRFHLRMLDTLRFLKTSFLSPHLILGIRK